MMMRGQLQVFPGVQGRYYASAYSQLVAASDARLTRRREGTLDAFYTLYSHTWNIKAVVSHPSHPVLLTGVVRALW